MKLTTTLNLIRACSPCSSGWKTLNEALGSDFDPDSEINLLKILETNGVQDMLWCLRTTKEDSKKIASQIAVEFAEQVLLIFEARKPNDNRPRAAVQAARDFGEGKITREELMRSHRGAYDAADAAAAVAAAAVATDIAAAAAAAAHAAYAHAVYARADAAVDAADSAAYDVVINKVIEKQADIIRSILIA